MPYKDSQKAKEQHRKYYYAHKEQFRIYHRKHYWKNPELARKKGKLKYEKAKARGLTKIWARNWQKRNPDKVRMWAIKRIEKLATRPRPERCEICNSKGRICRDHNHKTNRFRGWICFRCNTVLGWVDDDRELLRLLIDYLNKIE